MKKAALALVAVLTLVLSASALGDDFSQGKGAKAASNWKVHRLGIPPDNWMKSQADAFADGIGFTFGTSAPYPRFFMTTHPGSGLLGDLTGKTLTATFTITGTATSFTIIPGGPTENALCPTPASVRLYFERNIEAGFTRQYQWWSTTPAPTMSSLVGNTLTLSVPLTLANWSDRSIDLPDTQADFDAAVANVGAVGVSFGGGCFLPTSAVPDDGTATFVLKSYAVS